MPARRLRSACGGYCGAGEDHEDAQALVAGKPAGRLLQGRRLPCPPRPGLSRLRPLGLRFPQARRRARRPRALPGGRARERRAHRRRPPARRGVHDLVAAVRGDEAPANRLDLDRIHPASLGEDGSDVQRQSVILTVNAGSTSLKRHLVSGSETRAVASFEPADAVGHRVVHGGADVPRAGCPR